MGMERVLIAVDLDGTAMQDLYSLNPDTLRALKAAQAQGHIVMLATARPSCMTLEHYHAIGLNSPLAVLDGACIYHPKDPSFGRIENLISEKDIRTLLGLFAQIETEAVWIENDDELYLHGELEQTGYFGELLKCSKIHAVNELPHSAAARILAYTSDAEGVRRISAEAENRADIVWATAARQDGTLWLGFASADCDKWNGVQAVAKHYRIPTERIFAFGDEYNDRRMILSAGRGYVMRNGRDALKEEAVAAGAIMTAYDNTEGGVGRELDQALGLGVF